MGSPAPVHPRRPAGYLVRGTRSLASSWEDASFVALGWDRGDANASPQVVATVPIVRARVAVGGARIHSVGLDQTSLPSATNSNGPEEQHPSLFHALAGKYVVTWSPSTALGVLVGSLGRDSQRRLRRATIDLRALAHALDDPRSERCADLPEDLAETAGRFNVPVSDASDLVEVALTEAQLFLVLATHVAGRLGGDLRTLLRAGRFAGSR